MNSKSARGYAKSKSAERHARPKSAGRYAIRADVLYPLLLVAFGCAFLTFTDNWQLYTEPLGRLIGSVAGAREARAGEPGIGENGDPAASGSGDGIGPAGPGEEDPEGRDSGGRNGSGEENTVGGQESDDGTAAGEVEYLTVEDDYFADAVFIGDSRTVGLYEYGELQDIGTFYASTGLTVYKLFTDKIVEVPGQKKKITVEEALGERQFGKVYLMIGINEMGTGTAESFLKKYEECVAHIRELQPNAVIYLQSIMCVTAERSGQGDYITNEGIDIRNLGIEGLADNESIFYLDVNSAVRDETGAMSAGYTYDGVHLKAQYIALWKDYLKCHAVVSGQE
ncbi:MAG: GDSL-type esterase/lipase family protein [Clostridium sp.]|nr:GDSL-type esterase/lipase family protein [Acetatifactor muris]MCM1563791.1 GDSL-type esterase/lipase family protein [Clostridium sp.]